MAVFNHGVVNGWTGCNYLDGEYAVEDSRLVFSNVFVTQIGCSESSPEDEFGDVLVAPAIQVSLGAGEMTWATGQYHVMLRSPMPDSFTTEGDGFVPQVRTDTGRQILEVTFVDGSTATVEWPSQVDILSGGVIPYGSAELVDEESTIRRDLFVFYGTVDEVLSRLGGGELLAEHPHGDRGMVGLWRLPANTTVDYLVFGFESWTVLVHDYRDARRMSDSQRGLWAGSVTGQVTGNGFLKLLAEPPVSFARTGDGPWSPTQISIRGTDGHVTLAPGSCKPDVTFDEMRSTHSTWCHQSGQMIIDIVSSQPEFHRIMRDQLTVSDITAVP